MQLWCYYRRGGLNSVHSIEKERPQVNDIKLERGVNLASFSPRLSLAGQVGAVEVRGHDRRQKKVIQGLAKRSGNGLSRAGQEIVTQGPHGPTVMRTTHAQVSNDVEARTLAEAQMQQQEQRLISGNGTSFGYPDMRVGTRLDLGGLGRFSGTYTVSEVTHSISEGGYQTSFMVNQASQLPAQTLMSDGALDEPANAATSTGQTRHNGVVSGVVVENFDPNGRGMIKVKLPGMSDDENGHWARLATPDRGMFFLPNINDEVLVAFENGDINRPYILGVLWNDQEPPLRQPEENNPVRELRSRSGHIFRFQDIEGEEKIEIMDAHAGHSITLDSANNIVSIISNGDLEIKATQRLKLEGENIDLVASQNVEITADRETKLGQPSSPTRIEGQTIHLN